VSALGCYNKHPVLPQSAPPQGLDLVKMLVSPLPLLSTIFILCPVIFNISSSPSLSLLASSLCSVFGTKITLFTRLFVCPCSFLSFVILSRMCCFCLLCPFFLFFISTCLPCVFLLHSFTGFLIPCVLFHQFLSHSCREGLLGWPLKGLAFSLPCFLLVLVYSYPTQYNLSCLVLAIPRCFKFVSVSVHHSHMFFYCTTTIFLFVELEESLAIG
jgi:hypothetical protein